MNQHAFLLAVVIILGACCASLEAGEEFFCKSPDGNFALQIRRGEKPPYDASTAIVEFRSHKVVAELDATGAWSGLKLVWSPDSQHVAYFNPETNEKSARVLFRNGSSLTEIKLPELPSPTIPTNASATADDAQTKKRVEPLRWLSSGDLLLENEWQNPKWGRTAVEVTLGFEQDGSAVVRSSQPQKVSIVDYFLLLPADMFEGPPSVWLRHTRDGSGTIDKQNGYMSCQGDGAQPSFEVALFRYRDGRPLLALCEGELEGEDSVDLHFFTMGADGKMHETKRTTFPIADGSGIAGKRDHWHFDLPREGRTTLVRARDKTILHKVTWTGEKFQEEK